MSACDPELFRQGHALVALRLGDSHPPLLEELCTRMRTSTLLVDWHYCGGIPVILYVGSLDEARSQLEKNLDWFNNEHLVYMGNTWPDRHGLPYATLTMADVTNSPTAKSIGQIWNKV
jgi:hypothetical protein